MDDRFKRMHVAPIFVDEKPSGLHPEGFLVAAPWLTIVPWLTSFQFRWIGDWITETTTERGSMPTVEDIAVLLGKPFAGETITAVTGAPGREIPSDHDPGHPEDERHYYVVPTRGLQLLAGPDGSISTLFFMLEGDANVSAFPWSLRRGINHVSRPVAVRAKLGEPESSGAGVQRPGLGRTGPWDRFRFPPFGFLHVQYTRAADGISQMTLMTEAATPRSASK